MSEINPTNLLQNSKYAVFAAIEIHNKPIFPHRYQIVTISLINAWELLLKAFIVVHYPAIKILKADGTSKSFDECLNFVKDKLGKKFAANAENIVMLYQYRCEYVHFYVDTIDIILYSLIAKGVQLYNEFSIEYFGMDLAHEVNLVLLPIGFNPPMSPVDFLSKNSNIKNTSQHVQDFIKNIIVSTKYLMDEGIDEPILFNFNMAVINIDRVKNADIIAAIKNDESASLQVTNILKDIKISNDTGKVVRLEEASVYKDVYKYDTRQMIHKAKERFKDIVENKSFKSILREIKTDPNFYKMRHLDPRNEKSGGKGFYTDAVFLELEKYYKIR